MIHFYHVFAGAAWEEPVREHLIALAESGFPGEVQVGLVGPLEARLRACEVLVDHSVRVEADSGWEQVTLAVLHEHAQQHDDVIVYAHTKAASDPAAWKVDWRRSMTEQLIGHWAEALEAVEGGADLAGPHWIDDGGTPPHFSGNFWMGSAAYLRSLPPCPNTDRMDAEMWVGQNKPDVFNMLPGSPMVRYR